MGPIVWHKGAVAYVCSTIIAVDGCRAPALPGLQAGGLFLKQRKRSRKHMFVAERVYVAWQHLQRFRDYFDRSRLITFVTEDSRAMLLGWCIVAAICLLIVSAILANAML